MGRNAGDPAADQNDGAGDVQILGGHEQIAHSKSGLKSQTESLRGGRVDTRPVITWTMLVCGDYGSSRLTAYPAHLNERELAFVEDLACRPSEPSPRQFDWLNNLVARVEARVSL